MTTKNLKFLLFMLLGATLFTSCDPDGPIGGNDNPVLTLEAETGYVTDAAEVAGGTVFSVKLTAAKGKAELNTLTIQEAGTGIPAGDNRVTITGQTYNNPMLLFSPDTEGFTYAIDIIAHEDVSLKTYSFIVADKDGNQTSVSVDITTLGEPLTIVYNGSGNAVNAEPGTLKGFNLTATKGSSALSTVEVLQDGVLYANASDLSYGNTAFDANPYTIPASDQDGFTESIGLRVPAEEGTYVYTIKVTDVAGFEDSFDVTVNVAKSGTPVTLIEGALYNREGPAGTGGLDLDTGVGTGSSDGASEIKDLGGIENWKQQITGINGSTLQYLYAGQNGLAEDFTFAGVSFKEDLEAAKANGSSFVESNALNIGDMILVSNNDVNHSGANLYLIVVKDIIVTTGDNNDHYVFDIKY